LGRPGDGSGTTLGVLDFQDAVYGPITYDIASLMRDAFLSWDEDFVLDITVRYWQAARKAGLPVDDDFGAFYRAVEWMGLQRHLKVAGHLRAPHAARRQAQIPGRHAALHRLHPRHRQPLHGAHAADACDRRGRGHLGAHGLCLRPGLKRNL
jgi:hypothetical protein